MLIYKEQLPEDTMDIQLLELPFSTVEAARKAVLKIDMQYGTPCMWYQADAEEQCLISGEKNSFLVDVYKRQEIYCKVTKKFFCARY